MFATNLSPLPIASAFSPGSRRSPCFLPWLTFSLLSIAWAAPAAAADGSHWPPAAYVAPLATVLTALLAASLAWQSIENAREIARRKATLDLIEKAESTEYYRELTNVFRALRRTDSFDTIVDPVEAEDRIRRGQVIDYLNHYELVAIGIRNLVLDGDIYAQWMRSSLIRDWNAAAAWIQALRWHIHVDGRPGYDPRPYREFGDLAWRWSRGTAIRLDEHGPAPLRQRSAPAVEPL